MSDEAPPLGLFDPEPSAVKQVPNRPSDSSEHLDETLRVLSDEAEALTEGMNDAQRAAVVSEARQLCIIAGAGSGKTRVLTRRIAYGSLTGGFDPRRVLTVTFTRKAANELTSRLRNLGLRDSVAAGTFHGIAYTQLRSRWAEQGKSAPELLDRKFAFVARLIDNKRDLYPLDAIGEIEWAKARRIRPSQYVTEAARANRKSPAAPGLVAEVYGQYEHAKNKRGLIDFDDMLILCRRQLEDDPAYADAQRWRFRHLFVDEFQDVNPLQFALLQAWLGEESDLCVVGDPRQAIFGWNGADSAYLEQFDSLFPAAETIELRHNYRSSPQIIGMANAVLRHGRSLIPTRPTGPLPTTHTFETDRAEARGVARAIRDARKPGSKWSDQAVLVRTNAQVTMLEEALRKVDIPFQSRGAANLLDRPEVKRALRELKSHREPLSSALDALAETAEQLGASAEASSGDGDDTDSGGASNTLEDRRASLLTLVRLGGDYLAIDPGGDAGRFMSWLRTAVGGDHFTADRDGVDLATFHAAKGLEWPIVHVAGLEDGLVPIGFAKTAAALAEERNLMYVALTRAEQVLRLSWAQQRAVGKRTASRNPSPYLVQVEEAIEAVRAGRPIADPRDQIAEQKRQLKAKRGKRGSGTDTSTVSDDDPAFVALKQWRLNTARAANVPAYVVFPDATLKAVVDAKPTSADDLLRVKGIGKVKATRYGPDLLEVLANS